MIILKSQVVKHIYISGRVQRVGFRNYIQKNARQMNIKGWVKNLSDGRVEAVLDGKEADVDRLIKLARKGPVWARVDNITTEKEVNSGSLNKFKIKF